MLTAVRRLIASCLYCCEVTLRSIRHWFEDPVVVLEAVPVEDPVVLQAPNLQVPALPEVQPAVPDQATLRARRRQLIRTGPVAEVRTRSTNRVPQVLG